MPSISQLPPAGDLAANDKVPISQSGSACAIPVSDLLATMQPNIIVSSPSLIGRKSIGAGGPEEISLGAGIEFDQGAIIATGADHAGFANAGSLIIGSELVISDQGNQMLMPTATLRNLFSAGPNVAIDADGVISATISGGSTGSGFTTGEIGSLKRTNSLSAGDVIPVSQAGTVYAITYSNFLNGITIDQGQSAGPVSDADSVWVAQSSNFLVVQTFGAIWSWIAGHMSNYSLPVSEIVTSTVLTFSAHNGKVLVVTAANATLSPNASQMRSGFTCDIVTAPGGGVIWGPGIVATDGGTGLSGSAHAKLFVCSCSAGTVMLAAVSATSGGASSALIPGPVTGLALLGSTSSSLSLSWSPASTGGSVAYYTVQYRISGTGGWTALLPSPVASVATIPNLTASTVYDVQVAANNGTGTTSSYTQLLGLSTSAPALTVPGAPSGLTIGVVTSSTVALTWLAPAIGGTVTGYLVQYSSSGGSVWSAPVSFSNVTSGTVAGLAASTAYSFRIAALNAAGSGPYAPTSSYPAATTASAVVAPGTPTALVFLATYSGSITLQWTVPSGTTTGYNVQYRALSSEVWIVVYTNINSITVTGLSSNTAYEFQVQAVNGALTSAYSPSSTVTTSATNAGIYKLTPAPTRQSPSQGWVGTTITMAGGQPSSGYNVSDNSSAVDGSYPVPASVGFAWSTSNTVVPLVTNVGAGALTLDGHNLWYTWTVNYPSTTGSYYLWAIAKDGAGNIGGICVSPTPFTLR